MARQYNAPVFPPHVTVYAEIIEEVPDPAATRAALEGVVAGIPPFTLKVTKIGTSNAFTKTLFIEFADHDELSALSQRLREMGTLRSEYDLHPHLSLLYANLSEEEKQALVDAVQLAFNAVEFDRVAAVTGAPEVNTREDVQSWRIIAEAALHGKTEPRRC